MIATIVRSPVILVLPPALSPPPTSSRKTPKTHIPGRPPMPSQNPYTSLMKSFTSLPKSPVDKLRTSNETAPLFIAPHTEGEEVSTLLELPCGHILRQKDGISARSAGNGPLGSNKFLGDLLIADAIRCYVCESDRRKYKNMWKECELEKQSTADQ